MANVLGNLRKQVQEGRKTGTKCPCCNQYVREYDRRITASMVWALALVRLWYQKNDPNLQKWLKIDEYLKGIPNLPLAVMRGDFAKFVHWGLIERQKSVRDDGSNRVGYYRITPKGMDFLDGTIKVAKTVTLLNGAKIRQSDEQRTVNECLNKHFNYTMLMAIK